MDLSYRPERPSQQVPAPQTGRQALRASDHDRQLVADLLNAAYAEGRITMAEHSERVDTVWQAKTMGDLSDLTADLTGAAPVVQYQTQPVHNALVQPGLRTAPNSTTTIMGTTRREGQWHMPASNQASVLMGDAIYDLREATLESAETVLQIHCLMGDVKIFVPEGMEVRDETTKIMADGKTRGLRATAAPSATLVLKGLLIMGDIKVTGPDYLSLKDRFLR